MKKLLALLIALTLVVALCACTDPNTDESTPADTSSSAPVESETPDEPDESEEEPVDDDSEEPAEVSEEESEEVSEEDEVSTEPGLELPKDTNKYLSFGQPNTGDRITDADSCILTGYNEAAPVAGSVVLYDARFGANIPDVDWSEYAILTATYQSAPLFGFVVSDYKAVGEGSAVAIPADGFVCVAHKEQASDIAALEGYTTEDTIYPHGIQVLEVKYNAASTATPPTIDGVFDANEWGEKVDRVDIDNDAWDYQQFAAEEDYDTAADIYIRYDADYLYYCVVVEMDYHYCPAATSLWNNCSIQVNVSLDAPTSEYMSQHYDHIVDATATSAGRIGQWGYGVTDAGESAAEGYMGTAIGKLGEYKIVRDDAAQTTTYEVKMAWADMGFEATPTTGTSFGISFSINCREDATTWKNIRMRNGGGIIGRNDWSKMATITLS